MVSVLREEDVLWWERFVKQVGFKPSVKVMRVVNQQRKTS